MRVAAIILCFIMSGCIGVWKGNPTKPCEGHTFTRSNSQIKFTRIKGKKIAKFQIRYRKPEPLWWQLNTAGMKKSENPWEKFVPKTKDNRWDDPWSNFQEPKLFPRDWKPAKKAPKKTKKLKEKLKKKLDKKYSQPIILQQGKDIY